MKTTQQKKASDTRQPKLTRAVIRQLGGTDSLLDIASHSADAGWSGFTYYTDTVAFFRRNRAAIMARAEEDAKEYGQDMLTMIAGFVCLRDSKLGAWELAQALNGRGEMADIVQNAMAWYALEEIARELNPDL